MFCRRGWCAGVVPTAPRSLEWIRREMRQAKPLIERTRQEIGQAKPPARGGAALASLGLQVVFGCSLLLFPALSGGGPDSGKKEG